MLKAFGNFVIHNRVPFSIVESPQITTLLRITFEIRPNVSLTSACEIVDVYLKKEYNEMKKYVSSFEEIQKEKGDHNV